ncbi:MAG: 50S ribosomal protein L11 methyltransferase, partial [Candidatus Rokuibacteriota bacterium]
MRAFRITVPVADEDVATALLWEAGTSGLEVRSSPEGSVLLAYFPGPADVAEALRVLPSARLESVAVPDVDWVASFRESFRAFDVGGFRVVPAWEAPGAGPLVLRIDPARAFGTGTHETTRLC